jgi:predicted esterase
LQWFDNWKLTAPDERPEWMVEGLRESAAFVQGIVREEVRKVGYENVVLGGLSQGCAAILTTMILNSGETINRDREVSDTLPVAFFGMCGWLPFAKVIEEELGLNATRDNEGGAGNETDIFERNQGRDTEKMHLGMIRRLLRSKLDLPTPDGERDVMRPVFIGHGDLDDRVSVNLGRQAAMCLEGMGLNVRWKEYELLGHWYSDDMLRDILMFLQETVGWEIEGLGED